MEPVGRFLLGWRKPSTLSASTLNVMPDKTHRIDVFLVDLVDVRVYTPYRERDAKAEEG